MTTFSEPLDSLIVFSYGMTGAQDLAYRVAVAGLELSGRAQPKLSAAAGMVESDSAGDSSGAGNTCGALSLENLRVLVSELAGIDYPVVLRTTAPPSPPMIEFMNEGGAIIHASYYDPHKNFLGNLSDTAKIKTQIEAQIKALTQWLYRPNCLPIYQEDLARLNPEATAQSILSHLGLSIAPVHVLCEARKGWVESGESCKTRKPKNSSEISVAFPRFYQKLIRGRAELNRAGAPPLRRDETLL